jgi:hypothetical protein
MLHARVEHFDDPWEKNGTSSTGREWNSIRESAREKWTSKVDVLKGRQLRTQCRRPGAEQDWPRLTDIDGNRPLLMRPNAEMEEDNLVRKPASKQG